MLPTVKAKCKTWLESGQALLKRKAGGCSAIWRKFRLARPEFLDRKVTSPDSVDSECKLNIKLKPGRAPGRETL